MQQLHAVFTPIPAPYSLRLLRSSKRLAPTCTTYRDNYYIQKLNRLLQSETEASYLYSGGHHVKHWQSRFDRIERNHRDAVNCLTQLILRNQGIPETDDASLPSILNYASAYIVRFMPEQIGNRTVLRSCATFEKKLLQHYNAVLTLAPAADRAILIGLSDNVERNLAILPRERDEDEADEA